MSYPISAPPSTRARRKDFEFGPSQQVVIAPRHYGRHEVKKKRDTWASSFYRNNPDIQIDLRKPSEKLEDVIHKLDEYGIETSEKLTLLIQQISLSEMKYGENSMEVLRAHLALGQFYNENHRPLSALRHLETVQSLESTNKLNPDDNILISIETLEAHLNLRNDNKQESQRRLNIASQIIAPLEKTDISDPFLRHRRDLAMARISAAKGKIDDALKRYDISEKSLYHYDSGGSNKTAKLHVEIGDFAQNAQKYDKAQEYYSKAYILFMQLGMEESATLIKPKLNEVPEVETTPDNDFDLDESI